MDIPNIDPLPLEKEFATLKISRRFSELSREQLEEFLGEALVLLAKLTHQTMQLRDYIESFEGKTAKEDHSK